MYTNRTSLPKRLHSFARRQGKLFSLVLPPKGVTVASLSKGDRLEFRESPDLVMVAAPKRGEDIYLIGTSDEDTERLKAIGVAKILKVDYGKLDLTAKEPWPEDARVKVIAKVRRVVE